jgi:hypothetical protein
MTLLRFNFRLYYPPETLHIGVGFFKQIPIFGNLDGVSAASPATTPKFINVRNLPEVSKRAGIEYVVSANSRNLKISKRVSECRR